MDVFSPAPNDEKMMVQGRRAKGRMVKKKEYGKEREARDTEREVKGKRRSVIEYSVQDTWHNRGLMSFVRSN